MSKVYDWSTCLLAKAKSLIERPEGWTQHTFAKNADHCDIDATIGLLPDGMRGATCWCLTGALFAAAEYFGDAMTHDMLHTPGETTDLRERVFFDSVNRLFVAADLPPVEEGPPEAMTLCKRAGLERWNDHPRRTFQEVSDLLQKAILTPEESG